MKVEKSTVTKLTITGAPALDPITVYAEDIGPARGKIIIECYGKSWSSYWGSMGAGNTVAAFFCSCDEDYLANCFKPGIDPKKYDAQWADDALKQIVIERRRLSDGWRPSSEKNWDYESLGKEEARELWDRIEAEHFFDDPAGNSKIICDVTGFEEWWLNIPEAPNPDYVYLCRIIRAVQEALQ